MTTTWMRLPHHARNTARPVPWRLDRVLEVAVRDRYAVARPAIGPGAAAVLGLAGVDAGCGLGIRLRFERPVIAAKAVDGIFEVAGARLDDAGAAHARHAAARFHARYHIALEPAHRRAARGRRVGEAPGPAASLVFAAGGADRRIAVRHAGVRIIAARPVEARLRKRGRDDRSCRGCEPNGDAHDDRPHHAPSSRLPGPIARYRETSFPANCHKNLGFLAGHARFWQRHLAKTWLRSVADIRAELPHPVERSVRHKSANICP